MIDPVTVSSPITNFLNNIPVDPSAGAVTLTLVADSKISLNKPFKVVNVANSTNNIIIATDGTAKFYGYGIAAAGVTSLTISGIGCQVSFYKWATNKYRVTFNTEDLVTAGSSAWGDITGTLSGQTDLQSALDAKIPTSYLDTDTSLTADSDTKIATQKATKAYVDAVTGANIFKTIAVSGQSDVVADGVTDTLTLVAGTGMTITTNATTDTITFEAGGVDTTAWSSWAPSYSADSGTFTTVTTTYAYYKTIGKTCHFRLRFVITTNGTAAGQIFFTLPVNYILSTSYNTIGHGFESVLSGVGLIVTNRDADEGLIVKSGAGTYPGGTNANISVSGTYETV